MIQKLKYFFCCVTVLLFVIPLSSCDTPNDVSDRSFTITFVNQSEAEATVLSVSFSTEDQKGPFALGGVSAPYHDANDRPPMEQDEVYESRFTSSMLPVLEQKPLPEQVVLSFELDRLDVGELSVPLGQLWGSTIECQVDQDGVFSAQLTSASSD